MATTTRHQVYKTIRNITLQVDATMTVTMIRGIFPIIGLEKMTEILERDRLQELIEIPGREDLLHPLQEKDHLR